MADIIWQVPGGARMGGVFRSHGFTACRAGNFHIVFPFTEVLGFLTGRQIFKFHRLFSSKECELLVQAVEVVECIHQIFA